ncbi:hypothetical protein GF380_04790 [Candidatus Uhrbacteria bacterium]|nr:hypothetical protein [Candidatus Uhrbacteria bacterium]MBD3284364.1 hypothetical protein [Candidatus Uhrbacteria bacterium]
MNALYEAVKQLPCEYALAKRIILHLLRQSENLTKCVCFSLVENREGYTAEEIDEAAYDANTLYGTRKRVNLKLLLKIAGTELIFSLHHGDFLHKSEPTPGNPPMAYTFWLSDQYYDYNQAAKPISATRQALDAIELPSD